MTENQFVELTLSRPACQAWKTDDIQKDKALRGTLPMVAHEIITAYDFEFALNEKTEASVADQGQYTLKGNNDARDIVNIRYGSNSNLLARKTRQEAADYLSGVSSTPTAPFMWYPFGTKEGYPVVILYGAPASAGDDILYLYRRRNVPISEFPAELASVIVAGQEAHLFGTIGAAANETLIRTANPQLFTDRYDKALRKIIDDFRKDSKQDDVPPIGLAQRKKWRKQNALHGFG